MSQFSLFMLLVAILSTSAYVAAAETAALWDDFVKAKEEGREPVLPDFSYAGYHFSEKPIPDVSQRPRFDVTQFGAVANDYNFDDDAIQRAIETAEASQGGVVYFPPGRFLIAGDDNRRRSIRISETSIVLKGSGSGEGGSEIFADKMHIGNRQIIFGPRRTNDDVLATITADAQRESFWVEVDNPSELRVGQNVVIRHRSEEFTRLYFEPLQLAPEWTRLFGRGSGMKIAEIHTIAEIDGKRVRFINPIHFNLRLVASEPFTLDRYDSIRECGIEDIRFTGDWDSYPEDFVHHKNGIHDSGWDAISMENVEDSWIRRCEFRNWNECIFTRNAYKMSIEDVTFTGKKGHTSVHARGGYGTLIQNCRDTAAHHHGPGGGYGSVNLVVTRYQMQVDQSIDLHSGQSYACLYDDVEGGIFRRLGGPHEGLPHAGRNVVFWNFRHRSSFDYTYNFWSTRKRLNHTIADPVFAGFQPDRKIKFKNEGRNEMPGEQVEPRSLFEAQLELRLKKST